MKYTYDKYHNEPCSRCDDSTLYVELKVKEEPETITTVKEYLKCSNCGYTAFKVYE